MLARALDDRHLRDAGGAVIRVARGSQRGDVTAGTRMAAVAARGQTSFFSVDAVTTGVVPTLVSRPFSGRIRTTTCTDELAMPVAGGGGCGSSTLLKPFYYSCIPGTVSDAAGVSRFDFRPCGRCICVDFYEWIRKLCISKAQRPS